MNALFAAGQPPLKRPGKIVFSQSPDDRELLEGHAQAPQLPLWNWEEEIVC